MIIRLDGAAGNTDAGKRTLHTMARGWGHQITENPATTPAAADRGPGKTLDPVAVTSLVLSLPSTALAVSDLADRIRKRRRAQDLITRARQLAGQQVTASLVSHGRVIELQTLTPDQLLDLLAQEDPAEPSGESGTAGP